jgi:hypothetical protein
LTEDTLDCSALFVLKSPIITPESGLSADQSRHGILKGEFAGEIAHPRVIRAAIGGIF